MAPELEQALRRVRAVRACLAAVDDAILPHKQAYEEATADLRRQREVAAADLATAEAALREAAEAHFARTGQKQIAKGVVVKVYARLEYDPEQAIDYCLNNGQYDALVLDRKKFEELAKVKPLDFVRAVNVPVATIGKDVGAPTGFDPANPFHAMAHVARVMDDLAAVEKETW